MSLTFTLSDASSVLNANFFPPIVLGEEPHSIGLLSFDTYNTIPNVMDGVNNVFYYDNQIIKLPEGSYDIDAIEIYLDEQIRKIDHLGYIELRANSNTLKVQLRCSKPVYFNFHDDKPNSIGPMLGFTRSKTVIPPETLSESDSIVEILRVNTISVQCSLASGSYINGKPSHEVHSFFPAIDPGFKIIENPNPVIYYPLTTQIIDSISVRIVDQEQRLVDFRGETITVRLHVRKDGY